MGENIKKTIYNIIPKQKNNIKFGGKINEWFNSKKIKWGKQRFSNISSVKN